MSPPQPITELYATFAGSIDQQVIQRIFQQFTIVVNGGVKRVHLLIQSTGGFVWEGVAVYNYLRNLPLEIVTYNAVAVQSIAVLMYLAGTVRRASADASFLIHKTTFSIAAPQTAEMLRHRASAAERDDLNTDAILRSQISLPESQWALRDKADLIFGAEEAKKFGLVHEIADFAPPPGSQIFNI